ncbi:MAG: Fur family transcriptional regulator [Bacilli bacterium]
MFNEEIIDLLINKKYKITNFRKCLVDIFCENEHSLISAKMIKQILKDMYNYNASFDTIYKNLVIFCELNIIHEKIINHESYYVISKTFEDHHHFICLKCGEMYDIEDFCTNDFFGEKFIEFEVTGHNLEVYGLCSECKKIKDK